MDDDAFDLLDDGAKQAILDVIEAAKAKGAFVARPYGNGDVYSYPHQGGGWAWGLNGGRNGFCVARGVKRD